MLCHCSLNFLFDYHSIFEGFFSIAEEKCLKKLAKFPNTNVFLNFRKQFPSSPINGTCATTRHSTGEKNRIECPLIFVELGPLQIDRTHQTRKLTDPLSFSFFSPSIRSPLTDGIVWHWRCSSRMISSFLPRRARSQLLVSLAPPPKLRVALERKSRRATRESS